MINKCKLILIVEMNNKILIISMSSNHLVSMERALHLRDQNKNSLRTSEIGFLMYSLRIKVILLFH